MGKRYQHVEHGILTLILKHSDHRGYGNTLSGLASILRQTVPDIANREIIDTLKRLEPQYITLWKFSQAHARLLQYSKEEIDDEYLFGQGDFCIQRTPNTDPRAQELAVAVEPRETAVTPLDEAQRERLFARLETLGLDRVKYDLLEHMGRREVGGSPDVREAAWAWVRRKEADTATAKQKAPASLSPLIAEARLEAVRRLSSVKFNFERLVRLCEEINVAYGEGCYFATAMLTRALLDHVPPLF